MNNQMQLSFEGQKILKIENNVCTIDETSKNDRTTISAAKAMKMLDLSSLTGFNISNILVDSLPKGTTVECVICLSR